MTKIFLLCITLLVVILFFISFTHIEELGKDFIGLIKISVLWVQEGPSRNNDDLCYRRRKKGHWSKTCRTPEYLCKRYKASVEGKEKELNFNEIEPKDNTTCLEAADFVGGEINMD